MYTANLDGSFEFKKVGLTEKDLLGGGAEVPYLRLRHLHLLRRPAALRRHQPPYKIVHNRVLHRKHETLALSLSELSRLGWSKSQREKKDKDRSVRARRSESEY